MYTPATLVARMFWMIPVSTNRVPRISRFTVGPTIDFKIKQHMLGFTPLGISEERFVAAWVKIFTPLYAGAL